MDSKVIARVLKRKLRGLGVVSQSEIAKVGMKGDPRWLAVGWEFEAEFLGGEQIPEDRFEALTCFGDLVPLIVELSSKQTKVLTAA